MFESIRCSVWGHTGETDEEYQWDVPFFPSLIPEECTDGGFASYKWKRCQRCESLLETELVPTAEAPSPIETAPLL